MNRIRSFSRWTASLSLMMAMSSCSPPSDRVRYRGLPLRSQFPMDAKLLLQTREELRSRPRVAEARRRLLERAWTLFEGLTSDASCACGSLPIWRTWFTHQEVFPSRDVSKKDLLKKE